MPSAPVLPALLNPSPLLLLSLLYRPDFLLPFRLADLPSLSNVHVEGVALGRGREAVPTKCREPRTHGGETAGQPGGAAPLDDPVGVISVKDIVDYIAEFFGAEVQNVPPVPELVAKDRDGA